MSRRSIGLKKYKVVVTRKECIAIDDVPASSKAEAKSKVMQLLAEGGDWTACGRWVFSIKQKEDA